MDKLSLEKKLSNRQLLDVYDLKSIILHSLYNKKTIMYLNVSPSRFKKILSDYRALNALDSDDLDEICKKYDYFTLRSRDLHDENENEYFILKDRSYNEFRGKCINCNCEGQQIDKKERWINGITKLCFYKEMLNNNYTTKVNIDEPLKQKKK